MAVWGISGRRRTRSTKRERSPRAARTVGIYGGAFDPPHIAHVVVAAEARWQLGLDEVRLVPVGQPPHRAAPHATGAARLRMVRRAIEGHPGLSASSIEIDRTGLSYTVDTLRLFAEAEPGVSWTLIIGADQLLELDQWRDPQMIVAQARLGVVARGDVDTDAVAAAAQRHAPDRWALVDVPRIDVSSTLVREQIATGKPVGHLVSPPVDGLIAAEGLYRPAGQVPSKA